MALPAVGNFLREYPRMPAARDLLRSAGALPGAVGEIRLLFIVGFCGSFTTFSAFIHENLLLLRQSDLAGSALYVSLSVASGLLAVHAGHWLVKMG